MNLQELITRYKQFGGFRLGIEYAKLGAVPTVLKGLWRFTVKGSWFKVQFTREQRHYANGKNIQDDMSFYHGIGLNIIVASYLFY